MKPITILGGALALAALSLAVLALRGDTSVVNNDAPEPPRAAVASPVLGAPSAAEAAARAAVAGEVAFSYHLSERTQLRFHWTSRTETTFGSIDGAAQGGPSFALDGELLVTGAGRRGDDLVVELRFGRVTVQTLGGTVAAGEHAAAQLKRDLEAGTLVRLSRAGRILGYGFADMHPESRNWLRAIAGSARVQLGTPAAGEWTCEEADETGVAVCEHSWTGPASADRRAYARKKLRYVDESERAPRPKLASATTTGVFDAVLGWPSRAAGEQRADLQIAAMGLRVDARYSFCCELVEAASGTTPVADGERATDAPLTGADDVQMAHEKATAADFRGKLESVPTDRLVAALLELARGDLASPELLAAREDLVWAMRLWPERVADVLRAAQSGTLDDQGLMVLLAALGAVKNDAAQQALVTCIREDQGEKTRVFALRGMFQLDAASPATLEAVRAAARSGGTELVGSTAVLLLGKLAENDPRQVEALLAFEGEAAAAKRLDSWLLALGNARTPEALAAAQRHAGAEELHVRSAALDALGNMPGDGALRTLAERATLESDANLRAQAAGLLAGRDEPRALGTVDELLVREQDADVKIAALRVLARRLPNAAVERLLTRSAQGDAAERVRTFAGEALRR